MGDTRKVHLVDRDGRKIFNRLYDNGLLEFLTFESQQGHIRRDEICRNGWKIVPGWYEGEA